MSGSRWTLHRTIRPDCQYRALVFVNLGLSGRAQDGAYGICVCVWGHCDHSARGLGDGSRSCGKATAKQSASRSRSGKVQLRALGSCICRLTSGEVRRNVYGRIPPCTTRYLLTRVKVQHVLRSRRNVTRQLASLLQWLTAVTLMAGRTRTRARRGGLALCKGRRRVGSDVDAEDLTVLGALVAGYNCRLRLWPPVRLALRHRQSQQAPHVHDR